MTTNTSSVLIPIKVQCGCGQKYAFDVEAPHGVMPYTVACPVCGVDGTTAANACISESMGIESATSAPAMGLQAAPIESTAPPPPVSSPTRSGAPVKQVDILQVTHEARAKMMWGDAPEDVTKFLMLQGVAHPEAVQLSRALFEERAKTIRANGITKVWTGILLMCVPVITFIGFKAIGMIPVKILGFAGVFGLWGCWRVLKGTFMIISPKSEAGDVTQH